MTLPTLHVIIPTYNRPDTLRHTIAHAAAGLDGYEGEIRFIIGNDGEPTGEKWSDRVTELAEPTGSLGANLNRLIRHVGPGQVVMQMDDDHWLMRPIDVTQYVRDLLDSNRNIGWIRLFMGEEKDWGNPVTYYKFHAHMWGAYWYLRPDGEFYITSNRPHIKLTDFHFEHYGWYPEGKTLGETENGMCGAYNAKKRESPALPWAVIPLFPPPPSAWKHQVGVESWQKLGL